MTGAEPVARPWVRRRAVRLLVVDELDRLLLFQDSDLGLDPVARWWMTPGGGVDPGESDVEAAARELSEETGLRVDTAQVQGPIAERLVTHGYSDIVTVQDEPFFVVRCGAFEVDVSGHTPDEQASITQHRWWGRAELAATGEEIWPAGLVRLWELADRPEDWPLALGETEESTVAARQSADDPVASLVTEGDPR